MRVDFKESRRDETFVTNRYQKNIKLRRSDTLSISFFLVIGCNKGGVVDIVRDMKKIGVIVNVKRLRAEHVLDELKQSAQKHGLELFAENREIAQQLDATYLPIEQFTQQLDLVLALGGDGTVLYTARALHGSEIPIMGINLGSLGFLTSVSDSEIEAAFEAIATKSYKISLRDCAECTIFSKDKQQKILPALNDVVLGWGVSSRIVTLRLTIDEEAVGDFMCDGMMVSTPTGSTGHALSAGGPILHPGIGGFGINVICPHTLGTRPLVVPNTSCICIEVVNAAKELILSIDGQDEYLIQQGDRLQIVRSAYSVPLVQQMNHNYFSVLAQKLHWRGSSL